MYYFPVSFYLNVQRRTNLDETNCKLVSCYKEWRKMAICYSNWLNHFWGIFCLQVYEFVCVCLYGLWVRIGLPQSVCGLSEYS